MRGSEINGTASRLKDRRPPWPVDTVSIPFPAYGTMPSRHGLRISASPPYHYQPYGESWTGYLEATLCNRGLYLPSPSRFCNPWDCRPWFDLDTLNNAAVRVQ
ncbi:hypothetical protein OKW38_000157 [Paraburkholderia sp. MM5496-R1]